MEAVFLPCLKSGKLGQLQDQMTVTDPSLDSWISFLTATCRYLNKNQYTNTLYYLQLFMKVGRMYFQINYICSSNKCEGILSHVCRHFPQDFIRAAMTCISYFYQKGAMGYADLFQRIQHLLDAKQHLEMFLDQRQWGASSRGVTNRRPGWSAASTSSSARMMMTPGEVNKYVFLFMHI